MAMSINLPGVTITGSEINAQGEVTLTLSTGDKVPGGTMPGGYTRTWVDTNTSRMYFEKESGEQTSVCSTSTPAAMVRDASGPIAVPRMYTAASTTDGTGTVTFALPDGYFTSILNAQACVERNVTTPDKASFCWVSEWNMTRVVVRVAESKTTSMLVGGTAEGAELAGAGILVHLLVIGA